MNWRNALTMSLFLLICHAIEVRAAGERAQTGTPPPYRPPTEWLIQGSISHIPAADLEPANSQTSITDYRFRLLRNIRIEDKLTLSLGGGYGYKLVDADAGAGLPRDLHALVFEAGANYRFNDRSFASLRVLPGFYSDFKNIGSDDLRMPLLALGGYTFDNGISLVGGFLYRFGYHAAELIPALGISYQPNEEWKLDLVMPRPTITYSPSRQLQLFVGGDFSSDEYELANRSLGYKVIRYSDLKAQGGVSYVPNRDIKLTAAAGYAFERRFAFYDPRLSDMRLDDAPFFRLSVDWGW